MGAMMNPCKDCGRDRERKPWADNMTDYIHGNYIMLCSRCTLVRQLAHAREQAERIPTLEAALEAEDY